MPHSRATLVNKEKTIFEKCFGTIHQRGYYEMSFTQ